MKCEMPILKNTKYAQQVEDYQSEGLTERINEPPWGRCLQGAVDARWVVVCCGLLFVVVVAPQEGRDSPPAEL